MSTSTYTLLVLNAFAAFVVFMICMEAGDSDTLAAFLVAALALATNSVVVAVRDREQPAPTRQPEASRTDEMDARSVLDLDARLEALELAQANAADAARWRALVESGQVTGPAADAPGAFASSSGATIRNGH